MNNNMNNELGCIGLMNLGNTCYMNSCLQILAHTFEFMDFMPTITTTTTTDIQQNSLISPNTPNTPTQTQNILSQLNASMKTDPKNIDLIFFREWIYLTQALWSNHKQTAINPARFLCYLQKMCKIKNMRFEAFEQNDIAEFLLFIFDIFHNVLKRTVSMSIKGKIKNIADKIAVDCYKLIKQTYRDNFSEIYSIFYGIQYTQLISLKNHENKQHLLSLKPDLFFILELSPTKNTLWECLRSYCAEELMENENAWFNEKTNQKQSIYKKISFWSLPTILIIHFKRAIIKETSANHYSYSKSRAHITFPINNLNLTSLVKGYNNNNNNNNQYVYNLYGVCNHHGHSMQSGHYTSFIKHAKTGNWHHYNDKDVSHINESQIITPNACCLFYRRVEM